MGQSVYTDDVSAYSVRVSDKLAQSILTIKTSDEAAYKVTAEDRIA